MSSAFDEYLAKSQALAIEAARRQKQLNEDKTKAKLSEVKNEEKSDNRTAYREYLNYINPYAAASEKLASDGLGDSSLTETSRSRAYAAYQNSLSQNSGSAKQAKATLEQSLSESNSDVDLKLLQESIGLAKDELEEYWKNVKWDYQTYRDEVADARYNEKNNSAAQKAVAAKRTAAQSSSNSKTAVAEAKAPESTPALPEGAVRNETKISTIKKIVMQIAKDNLKVRSEANLTPYIDLIKRYGGNSVDVAYLRKLWGL